MLIYAHRGASADFPELTEAAYNAAIDQGADGFECDLRLTHDEVPILWHNSTMLDVTGHDGAIAEMSYSEILKIYPDVMTLNQFLDIALHHQKGVLLETKHPVKSRNRIEEIVIQTLRNREALDSIDVSVMSFSSRAIKKMQRIAPEIPTTLLINSNRPWLFTRRTNATMIAPSIDRVHDNPDLIREITALGKKSAIWTVDNGADIEMARDLGVDILITNMPGRARTFL